MAGSPQVTADVHHTCQANLKYSCVVGNSHWETGGFAQPAKRIPGPRPKVRVMRRPGKIKGEMVLPKIFFGNS